MNQHKTAFQVGRYRPLSALVALRHQQLSNIVYFFLNDLGLRTVHTVSNSLEAFRLIETVEYALCFVDYDIEDMGGPTLTRFIRTCENRTANAHVFGVVMQPDRQKVCALRDAGAHTILGLPLTTGLLQSRVDRALAGPEIRAATAGYKPVEGPAIVFRGMHPEEEQGDKRSIMAVAY